MNKLTLELVESKRENATPLQNYIIDYVVERWEDYDKKENIFFDVLNNGCVSGIVSSLIYYKDTLAFFEKYKEDINTLLCNILCDCGYKSMNELFGSKWDSSDPLAMDINNQNLLAWFGFEEELRNLMYDLDIEY